MVLRARLGHPGGDLSVTDILATLYFGVMRIDPREPRAPGRDRLILSKGHASGALYATLAEVGFIPIDDAVDLHEADVDAERSPNRNYVPGVEANTGPLGHGLPIAVGIAIAGQDRPRELSRLRHNRRRRIAGREQLGGGDGRGPSQARQSDADRRPQHVAAGRAGR